MAEIKTSPGLRDEGIGFLREIFEEASCQKGEDLLKVLVRGMGTLLEAETTFIAWALDDPATRVRGVAAWKDGAFKAPWEYDLEGNPCQLTYDGEPTFIPCDVAKKFESKKDSGYASYIGIPLTATDGSVIGHIAVYASRERSPDAYALEIAKLCGYRAESEVRNMLAEQELHRQISDLTNDAVLKDEAVRTVAHDLRSPLATVIASLAVAETKELPVDISDLVVNARTGAERLLSFATDYLDLQRLEQVSSGGGEADIDLSELVDEMVPEFQAQGAERDLSYNVVVNGSDLVVRGDAQQLRRVIENLVSNANKFSPVGEEITIEIDGTSEYLSFRISDRGPGVAERLKECLFDPFLTARAPGSTAPGSGLGLSLAKAIIERHRGTIGFENRNPGTTFVFELPRASEAGDTNS
jgi:signal transduction histidine kinase